MRIGGTRVKLLHRQKIRRRWTRADRAEVLRRSRGKCVHCGRKLAGLHWEMDHLHPLSRGGRDNIGNMVASCWSCNRKKGAKIVGRRPFRWRLFIAMAVLVFGGHAVYDMHQPGGFTLQAQVTPALTNITVVSPTGTNPYGGLVVRNSPSGQKVGSIYDGQMVLLMDKANGWDHVSGSNFQGYVDARYVAEREVAANTPLTNLKP